ncbi:MAG TPA: glycosyltransferase [Phycisphaerales bacterium]|nr:glycosyltransferase [Phycisphaerales bacterium]
MSRAPLNIAFFGSSLVSAYWNGAATYYRGLIRALAERGHKVTFYEPDAFERQKHRDLPNPSWAEVVVYDPATEAQVRATVEQARGSDVVIKASGVGVHDALLEEAVLGLQSVRTAVAFWDVDAPATLSRVEGDRTDPFRPLIPKYDLVFTYGGAQPVIDRYKALGARDCVPVYNALDPTTHFPVPRDDRFAADLTFLGNRLPDREARVEEFFLRPSALCPRKSFLLAGNGWQDKNVPANVRRLGHVYTTDHNALNCTPLAVLNVTRESMASNGWSPATRVFECAGAGACLITDYWEGIGDFLTPGSECLVARSGDEVAELLATLTPEKARAIGEAARIRILSEHTYTHRALQVEEVLTSRRAAPHPHPTPPPPPPRNHDHP